MNDKKNLWAQALEIFSAVSGWIAGPIILALVSGKYLDGRFHTKPLIFLGLTGVAFVISAYGILKVVGQYLKKIQKDIEEKKENKDGK